MFVGKLRDSRARWQLRVLEKKSKRALLPEPSQFCCGRLEPRLLSSAGFSRNLNSPQLRIYPTRVSLSSNHFRKRTTSVQGRLMTGLWNHEENRTVTAGPIFMDDSKLAGNFAIVKYGDSEISVMSERFRHMICWSSLNRCVTRRIYLNPKTA